MTHPKPSARTLAERVRSLAGAALFLAFPAMLAVHLGYKVTHAGAFAYRSVPTEAEDRAGEARAAAPAASALLAGVDAGHRPGERP
jgi:hypothetical protein